MQEISEGKTPHIFMSVVLIICDIEWFCLHIQSIHLELAIHLSGSLSVVKALGEAMLMVLIWSHSTNIRSSNIWETNLKQRKVVIYFVHIFSSSLAEEMTKCFHESPYSKYEIQIEKRLSCFCYFKTNKTIKRISDWLIDWFFVLTCYQSFRIR